VDRSQIKNRQIALQTLKARIYQKQLDAQVAATQAARKQQVSVIPLLPHFTRIAAVHTLLQ
jgi:protein subunit release factor A